MSTTTTQQPRQQPIHGFLKRQVGQPGGYLKVAFAPIAILAAVGGALGLFGDNWLILVAVAGCATAVVALVLVGVEHTHSKQLKTRLQATETSTDQRIAGIESTLNTLIESVYWTTACLRDCCLVSTGKTAELADMVLDDVDILLGPASDGTRITIYYGDESRLEPKYRRRWRTSPKVLVANTSHDPNEFFATPLIKILKCKPGWYVHDVMNPPDGDRQLVDNFPEHGRFRTLACFPLQSFAPAAENGTGEFVMVGLLVVQDARVGALSDAHVQAYLSILSHILTVGLSAPHNHVKKGA